MVAPGGRDVLRRRRTASRFGVFTAGRDQITDAQVAIYATPGRDPSGPAIGPFPARIEDLTTKPAFRAKTTADDPSAAQVAYVSDIPLDKTGPWAFGALIKTGDSYQYSLLPTPHPVGQYPAPRVGQKAPVVHTPTVGSGLRHHPDRHPGPARRHAQRRPRQRPRQEARRPPLRDARPLPEPRLRPGRRRRPSRSSRSSATASPSSTRRSTTTIRSTTALARR